MFVNDEAHIVNWLRNYFSGSQAETTDSSTPVRPEELDAVDRLYAAAGKLEPSVGFRAVVRRRISASDSRGVLELIRLSLPRLPRPLLAGAMSIAVLLLGLNLFWGSRSPVHAEPVIRCEIKGMICQGCAQHVSAILSRVPGVRSAQVDAKTARARIVLQRGSSVSLKQLSAALDETKHFQISDVSVATEPEQP